jgi:truncated hemoglobin YjbI
MEPHDIEARADIETLVSEFYGLVRHDELLGGIRFKSRALLRHLDVDEICPLCPFHFNRWCTLFERSVENQFSG